MTIPLQATDEKTLSAELVEVSPSRHLLSLRLPALCCDGRGLENLLHEIGRSYEATLRNEQMLDEPLLFRRP